MKRKILIIIVLFVLLIVSAFLVLGFSNETFFKEYYETTNDSGEKVKIPLPKFSYYLSEKQNDNGSYMAEFYTFKDMKDIDVSIQKYMDKLQSCYDESYFYDKDLDITIISYTVVKGTSLNKIKLYYEKSNRCKDEFTLADDWIDKAIDIGFYEAEITEYIVISGESKPTNKKLTGEDMKDFLEYVNENGERIEKDDANFGFNPVGTAYLIEGYFGTDVLSVFVYDNYLAFVIHDQNDAPKNALYSINNPGQLLIDIYNKY